VNRCIFQPHMKLFACLALLSHVQVFAAASDPIRRVVDLLTGLRGKCEADLQTETDLYEAYDCWYKSIAGSKGASNDAAQTRIGTLESYIADIDANRIEFTTERHDLTKQVKDLTGDLEKAKALRDQEMADYNAAITEMDTAIQALGDAIQALKSGAFLQSNVGTLNLKWSLRKALEVGQAVLDRSDVQFMESVLDDETPNPDWKKLNRKATFKTKYSARSSKIVSTLESMKETFSKNRKAAETKESQAAQQYGTLDSGKKAMLTSVKKALVDLTEETGARGLSKSEAQQEIDALKAQIIADAQFASDAKTSHTTKSQEWQARKDLRQNEITAINKALEILHSDDARDLFRKSFHSQGYSFLQVSARARCQRTWHERAASLHEFARAVHDPRVNLLAMSAKNAKMKTVIESIDKLVTKLDAEGTADLANKETCEKDLGDNYGQARASALKIDDNTAAIDSANVKILQINDNIVEQQDQIKSFNSTLQSAIKQRADENAKFGADKLDDVNAKETIKLAIEALKKWKTGGKQVLTQIHHHQQLVPEPQMSAIAGSDELWGDLAFLQVKHEEPGQAPTAAPATWDAPEYGGATGESQGVVAIMELISDDIQKDIDLAKKTEAQAVTDFGTAKTDLETAITTSEAAITAYESEKVTEGEKVTSQTDQRATEKTTLDATMTQIRSLEPGCDYILVNFKIRVAKRQVEIDGLKKAKSILKSSKFGQAFLQC